MMFDHMQNCGIIASTNDALWVNIDLQEEVDIDDVYHISQCNAVLYDKVAQCFYMLCNKYKRSLGYYLLAIDAQKPDSAKAPRFLMRWMNKLEMENAALHLIEVERPSLCGHKLKKREIVVSQKSAFNNLYTIFVIDLETSQVRFRFETNHLWEHEAKGFITSFNDFIILNHEGLAFIPLGIYEKRSIKPEEGAERMVHSLTSCQYLRVEESNFLYFSKPTSGDCRIMKIQDQNKTQLGETEFCDIYKISFDEMTLRELILLQSIFYCRSQANIVQLIEI